MIFHWETPINTQALRLKSKRQPVLSPVSMRNVLKKHRIRELIGSSHFNLERFSTPLFLFHFLLKYWKLNSHLTLSKYIHIIRSLYSNSWGKLCRNHYSHSKHKKMKLLIPSIRQWQSSAVLPASSSPAASFSGVMATVCNMWHGH